MRGSAHKAAPAAEPARPRGGAVLHEGDWAAPTAPRLALIRRLREQGIVADQVLAAIARIPRERFVDEALWSRAYEDTALPIGFEQTISQPVVVARMIEAILPAKGRLARVLEVGTGCGYQAAVLARLARQVMSVERLKPLHDRARMSLAPLGIHNIRLVHGDGMLGHPPNAPYDSIIAAAGGESLPQAWLDQLAVGGRLVSPVRQPGRSHQVLVVVDRNEHGCEHTIHEAVNFVPLISGIVR